MDSVKLHELLLLEVNYQYESRSVGDTTRPPLCLLLLGLPLDDHEKFEIQRSIAIPLRLQVINDQDGQFVYDLDQVTRRIKLARETNPQLQLCGIMVVNDQIYDYEKPIESLMQHFEGQIEYLFTYKPDSNAEMGRKLNGFSLLPQRQRIGYRLIHGKVNIETQKIDASINSSLPEISDRQRMDQELSFVQKLTQEIDKMIRYLDLAQPSDAVLRKISMLVSQLKRGPTTDIEEMIMNKEGEINALRTICEQWEMGVELGD
ncbi:hypothetical protein ZYGR_0P02540 [Zygosaccharomyces rouxii]|uniref:ZYRO0E06512p n=2 Tax=Zygosaccharomyces rouxii TaxID=4956 RepID=C5E4I9_ZYGRC|nr:uncharacterized protein ZYRO0E06512g [Zygosaccharomyces rouxii]GAV49609.1 hypothetical protein ZYGR_0P02540 [Zygosaccharomyces rouxii]CAR30950.1 ZYRO0E06512p [Zygosaccharomyces rouxii]